MPLKTITLTGDRLIIKCDYRDPNIALQVRPINMDGRYQTGFELSPEEVEELRTALYAIEDLRGSAE